MSPLRQNEYAQRMAEASRELPPDATEGRDSGKPWGYYRRKLKEPRPPTMKEWIERMRAAMMTSDQGPASLGSYRADREWE